MSFELNGKDARVLYVNFRSLGDGEKECEAEQLFSFSHLIEDSSKYLVSIERFRIPIQAVPMQDAINNAIILRSKTGGDDVFISTIVTFGLYDWLLQLSRSSAAFDVILTSDGRAQILNFDFDAFSIELSQKVADILDMDLMIDGADIRNIIGATPMFDRFDQFFKLSIEALNGLSNIQQEIVDGSLGIFVTQLTDFIVPTAFSMSVTNPTDTALNNIITLSLPLRQDLEFNASNARRLINFRGTSPIQNMRVRVVAIYRDGTRHAIILPRNGVFELKIALFKKG